MCRLARRRRRCAWRPTRSNADQSEGGGARGGEAWRAFARALASARRRRVCAVTTRARRSAASALLARSAPAAPRWRARPRRAARGATEGVRGASASSSSDDATIRAALSSAAGSGVNQKYEILHEGEFAIPRRPAAASHPDPRVSSQEQRERPSYLCTSAVCTTSCGLSPRCSISANRTLPSDLGGPYQWRKCRTGCMTATAAAAAACGFDLGKCALTSRNAFPVDEQLEPERSGGGAQETWTAIRTNHAESKSTHILGSYLM